MKRDPERFADRRPLGPRRPRRGGLNAAGAPHPHPRRRAFTLIELLVSIALMAMLLSALLMFVFSMSEIWGKGSEERLFNQHVDAVTRHVESMLRRAALPAGGGFVQEPFTIKEINTTSSGTVTGLDFTLTDGDRLLQWSDRIAPFAQCVLATANGRGLVLYWRSQLETEDDTWHEAAPFPFVTQLGYNYFDADNGSWREETTLQHASNGNWLVPDQLVLHFVHGKFTADRTLTLPVVTNGIPAF